jgi:hypothetical protein
MILTSRRLFAGRPPILITEAIDSEFAFDTFAPASSHRPTRLAVHLGAPLPWDMNRIVVQQQIIAC